MEVDNTFISIHFYCLDSGLQKTVHILFMTMKKYIYLSFYKKSKVTCNFGREFVFNWLYNISRKKNSSIDYVSVLQNLVSSQLRPKRKCFERKVTEIPFLKITLSFGFIQWLLVSNMLENKRIQFLDSLTAYENSS